MKKICRLIIILFYFFSWINVSLTFGQPGSLIEEQTLTLEECIDLALKNSTELALASKEIYISKLNVTDEKAKFLPTIDLDSDYTVDHTRPDFKRDTARYESYVKFKQVFYTSNPRSGRRFKYIERNKARLTADQKEYQAIKNDLILETVELYYSNLRSKELVKVNEEFYQLIKEMVDMARAKCKIGTAPETDVIKLQVELSDAQAALIKAENNFKLWQAGLNELLALPQGTTVNLVDTKELRQTTLAPEECYKQAFAQRPEIGQKEAELEASQIDLEFARRDYWPSLSLEGEHIEDISGYRRRYRREKGGWQIGAILSYPLFDGFTTIREGSRKKAILEKSEAEFSQVKRDISLEVNEANINLSKAQEVVRIINEQVKYAKESLEATENQYRLGIASMTDVINVQVSYIEAKTSQIYAFYDLLIAEAMLNRAIGKI